MANVTMIPARMRRRNPVQEEAKPKLRVAAYCRVSTDTEEQATSYEAQVAHYTEYIQKNSEWELAGIYADDGISGTNTKKREEFNRMIEDCMAGRIDMVITKSISRFARNTIDCLQYIRKLKEKSIPVFFEKENINTMDAKGELLLTIMASLAQQESQSLSQNVKLGLQFRYQAGKVQVNTNRFLGYTKDADGNLVIVPEEAAVIKRIYREYLDGASLQDICNSLMADGILTGAGKAKWIPSTVRKILTNEKYIGDALLQKTVTTDFLEKKRVINYGIAPQYYVEGSHEAIIPKDKFRRVQEELVRRANLYKGDRRRVYSSKYALSSICTCENCGDVYRRIAWNNRGKHSIVWRCCSRVNGGKKNCDSPTIKEEYLQQKVVEAVNIMWGRDTEAIKKLQELTLQSMDLFGSEELESINQELYSKEKELFDKALANLDYDDLADEVERLKARKEEILLEQAMDQGRQQRKAEMEEFFRQQCRAIMEYDEQLVRRLIEAVTIHQDGSITFRFMNGATVTI